MVRTVDPFTEARAMGPALVAAGLGGSDVAVWHALRAHLAYRGEGWPSQAQLVAASGCSISTVMRAVRRLVAAGFLAARRLRRGDALPNGEVVFAAERLVYAPGPRALSVMAEAAGAARARPLHPDRVPTRSPCASDPFTVVAEVEIKEVIKISADAREPPMPMPAPEPGPEREKVRPPVGGEEQAIATVLEAYRAQHFPDDDPAATAAERAAVRERLREGFSVATLSLAVRTTLPGPRSGGPPPLRWICNPDHLRNHIRAGQQRLVVEARRRAETERDTALAKAAPPDPEPRRPGDPHLAQFFAAMVPPAEYMFDERRDTA
jgi:hypothetical protein